MKNNCDVTFYASPISEEKVYMNFFSTENGWQTAESFQGFMEGLDKDVREGGVVGPYIIYLDGYPAHLNLPLYKWCRERGIILVLLYPNSTHILQPLDLVVFRMLKCKYESESNAYKRENKKEDIDNIDFVRILGRSIKTFLPIQSVKKAFRAAGLHPFNRKAVHDERLVGNLIPNTTPSTSSNQNQSYLARTYNQNFTHAPSDASYSLNRILEESSFDHIQTGNTSYSPLVDSSLLSQSQSNLTHTQTAADNGIASKSIQQLISSTPAELFAAMKVLNESLKHKLQHDDQILTLSLIDQMIVKLEMSNPLCLTAPAAASMTDPQNLSFKDILPKPISNTRVRKGRQVKFNKSGVMSSDENIEKLERAETAKQLIEEKQAELKKAREELKQLKAAKDLQIKQERVEKAQNANAKRKKSDKN